MEGNRGKQIDICVYFYSKYKHSTILELIPNDWHIYNYSRITNKNYFHNYPTFDSKIAWNDFYTTFHIEKEYKYKYILVLDLENGYVDKNLIENYKDYLNQLDNKKSNIVYSNVNKKCFWSNTIHIINQEEELKEKTKLKTKFKLFGYYHGDDIDF